MALGDWGFASVVQPTVYRGNVPTSATELTSTTVWLLNGIISNTTGSMILFNLTHSDGTVIMKDYQVYPGADLPINLNGPFQCVGIKWSANAVGLKGQIQVH